MAESESTLVGKAGDNSNRKATRPAQPVVTTPLKQQKLEWGTIHAFDQSEAADTKQLGSFGQPGVEQLIYEVACEEAPYRRYSPWEVLQVQDARRRRMEELKCRIRSQEFCTFVKRICD